MHASRWLGGRHDECLARQWRTRMFECFAAHQVGSPQSERALVWLLELKTYFESNPSNQARWTSYLDNLQKQLDIKKLTLEHLQHGPTNLGKDAVVAQCVLPFLNNAFSYVPLSLKLSNFLKMGVYDPAEGKIHGANLQKLRLQYHQYIFDELDYKALFTTEFGYHMRYLCSQFDACGCRGRVRATRLATTERRAAGGSLSSPHFGLCMNVAPLRIA